MKAKTFENLIRKIIREEIDYSLRREIKALKEDLRDELKPTIIENSHKMVEVPNTNPPLPEATKTSLKEKIMGKKPIKKQNFIPGNSALNDLLNETAQGDTNLNNGMSPVSMEGDFDTIGELPMQAAPKAIQEAVTRDYSSLMKAIDKKKNNNRP